MSDSRKRKVYDETASIPDACPKCGCRHYECVTAWERGVKIIVERICRNCGARV